MKRDDGFRLSSWRASLGIKFYLFRIYGCIDKEANTLLYVMIWFLLRMTKGIVFSCGAATQPGS